MRSLCDEEGEEEREKGGEEREKEEEERDEREGEIHDGAWLGLQVGEKPMEL